MSWKTSMHVALGELMRGNSEAAANTLRAAIASDDDFGRLVECPECGLRDWPGMIVPHRRFVHGVEFDEAA